MQSPPDVLKPSVHLNNQRNGRLFPQLQEADYNLRSLEPATESKQGCQSLRGRVAAPAPEIRGVWRADSLDAFDDAAIPQLADRFGVSAETLFIRFIELDLA